MFSRIFGRRSNTVSTMAGSVTVNGYGIPKMPKNNDFTQEKAVCSYAGNSSDDEEGHTCGESILDSLNYYCLMHIFSFLTFREMVRCRAVSKKWEQLITEKLKEIRHLRFPFWTCDVTKVRSKHRYSITIQNAPYMISTFSPNITHLRLYGVSSRNWKILFTNCGHLKILAFFSCTGVLDKDLENMKCRLEELLLVSASNLTGDFLTHLDSKLLKRLTLNRCYNISNSCILRYLGRFINLEQLSLNSNTHIFLSEIVKILPKLREFSYCDFFVQYHVPRLTLQSVRHLSQLEVLFLSRNPYVNNKTLKMIAENCPKLTTLDISERRETPSEITEEGISHLWKLKNLKELAINNLQIGDAGFEKLGSVGGSSKLEVLLCKCNVSITNLGILRIVQMCPNIRKIDVSGAIEVNDKVIKLCNETLLSHPNRTGELYLYLEYFELYIERFKRAINKLETPLIKVFYGEENHLSSYDYEDVENICNEFVHFCEMVRGDIGLL